SSRSFSWSDLRLLCALGCAQLDERVRTTRARCFERLTWEWCAARQPLDFHEGLVPLQRVEEILALQHVDTDGVEVLALAVHAFRHARGDPLRGDTAARAIGS